MSKRLGLVNMSVKGVTIGPPKNCVGGGGGGGMDGVARSLTFLDLL